MFSFNGRNALGHKYFDRTTINRLYKAFNFETVGAAGKLSTCISAPNNHLFNIVIARKCCHGSSKISYRCLAMSVGQRNPRAGIRLNDDRVVFVSL